MLPTIGGTQPHQHQSGSSSSSPFGQSVGSSSLYGGGNTAAGGGQDFLYGQASNQYPMYQSGNGGLQQQQASEYVFPGISASQSGGFAFGNYGSPNGNNAQVMLLTMTMMMMMTQMFYSAKIDFI